LVGDWFGFCLVWLDWLVGLGLVVFVGFGFFVLFGWGVVLILLNLFDLVGDDVGFWFVFLLRSVNFLF